jgi:hypothetical protein
MACQAAHTPRSRACHGQSGSTPLKFHSFKDLSFMVMCVERSFLALAWHVLHQAAVSVIRLTDRHSNRGTSMATASPSEQGHLGMLSWYLSHCPHDEWERFSPAQQEEMIKDDLTAATTVSIILGAVVTGGLVLCSVTLAIILLGG